jgi:hypothetical protein
MAVPYRPRVVSPLNCVPKKTPGKFRVILDLRTVNSCLIPAPSFKYEAVTDSAFVFRPKDWLTTVDLSQGYFHLEIRAEFWTYLGFQWDNQFYVFTALPMGLSNACWAFTKLLREPVEHWRRQGIRLIHYLDDFAVGGTSVMETRANIARVVKDLRELGFYVNEEKSVLEPAQECTFLGIIINTLTEEFKVTPARAMKLMRDLRKLLEPSTRAVTARTLFSIGGQIGSMKAALGQAAMLFSRSFYRLADTRHSWNSYLRLTEDVRAEARFWVAHFDIWNGKRIWNYSPIHAVSIWTDASGTGWGGVTKDFGTLEAHGLLPPDVFFTSSTFREIYGILCVLQSFGEYLRDRRILLRTDSQPAMYNIRKGGHMNPTTNQLLLDLYTFTLNLGCTLKVEWVPRGFNQWADYLSKIQDSSDWKLSDSIFLQLEDLWGPHEVDRMASDTNKQLLRFNSRWWCPGTEAVDCFTQDWSGSNNWCNPDFNLITQILEHMSFCRAHGTIIIPKWVARPWWPLIQPTMGIFAPWITAYVEIPAAEGVFVPAYGGHTSRVTPPRFHCLALRVDFSTYDLFGKPW